MAHTGCGIVMTFTLLGTAAGALEAGAYGPAPVRPRFDDRGGVTVPVTIDGAGPFPFVLDTGSTRTTIGDDLAGDLHAPFVARAEVLGSAGAESHVVAQLLRVEVAGARAPVLLASVVPAAALRAIGPDVRGVLGQDFLSAFNYTLDYERRRLTWDDDRAPACSGRAALPLASAGARYVVRIAEDRSRRSLTLVPDTGSEALVLFARTAADAPPSAASPAVAVSGLTGTTTARLVEAPPLLVGRVRLGIRHAVIVERSDADADGLLPLHLFARVSFNMRDGCMVVHGR